MACTKCNILNTGNTNAYFTYLRCDDNMWEYQVEIEPGQSKNIWLVDGTYSTAFRTIVLSVCDVFPPTPTPSVTPTLTPSNTPGPTSTPTNTPTSSQTPTPSVTTTQTPTNTPGPSQTPTQTPTTTPTPSVTSTSPLYSFSVSSGSTSNEACNASPSTTLYGFYQLFDSNVQFFNESSGVVSINLTGFYSDGTSVTELNSSGAQVGSFNLCSGLASPTPTQTPTNTPTPTSTVTPTVTETPTNTPTPTQTFAWYTYTLGTGVTSNDACLAFTASPQTIYGTVSGGIGPNVGEYLYETAGIPLTDAVPDGYYSNGTAWFQVTGGSGQITSSDPNGCI